MKFLDSYNYEKNITQLASQGGNQCYFVCDGIIFNLVKNRLTKTISVFVNHYDIIFSIRPAGYRKYKVVKLKDKEHKEYMLLFDYIMSRTSAVTYSRREKLLSLLKKMEEWNP